MGLVSNEIVVQHDGNEILLSVKLTGQYFSTGQYKLYIDGQLADEERISIWNYFFGSAVILRGQLPPCPGKLEPRRVKVVANLRVIRSNDYLFFIDDEQIHQAWATYGGV